jgi:hypothetical protein
VKILSSGGDSLFVTIGGRDVGLSDILKRVDAEMQKSADQAVKLGQSYARLASAQGSPAAGAQILAGTIGQAGAASEKAIISVETQAARLSNSGTFFQQFGASAASSLTSIVGPAALATGAITGLIAVGQSFAGAFQFKAALDASTLSIDAQLKGLRDSAQVWSEATTFANTYKLTTQETTEAIQASVGVLRVSKSSVEDVLGVLARLQVLSPEQSLQEAALAVKALASGDITSLVGRFEVSRNVANQMKQEILGGADAVQVLSKFLGDSGVGMDVLKTKTEGASGALRDLAIAQENVTKAQGEIATSGTGVAAVQLYAQAWQGLANLLRGDVTSGITGLAINQVAAAAATQAHTDALQAGATEAQAAAIAQQVFNDVVVQSSAAEGIGAAATDTHTKAKIAHVSAEEAATAASEAAATALLADAEKSQLAAVGAQELTLAKTTLAQAAQQAANVILAGGGNIAATAARLAASSAGVDVLTAAYLRLAAAQATATGVKLQQQTARQLIGPDSESASVRKQQHDAIVEDRNTKVKAASDAARAEENYQKTLKNTGPALAHARNELAQLTVGSAAYINKQNDIAKLEQESEKNAKKAKGAAGAKLSDQQKLQNQLLASNEDYANKSEDAEQAHADAVAKINADFYEKMLAAQRDFDQERLDSRAGFYDQQGSIESDAVRKAASQQYEAAALESEKIAQEKGADVANAYMDAQEKIINDRAKRQDEIQKALNKKDKKEFDPDKAAYLQGVDELHRRAEDAKLARLKEGAGSIADEHQKQLDDEAQKAADAQDKIALANDRATEKKIVGSERAGKKIDEEKLKVDNLKTSYDNLGASGARAGITPGAGATTGAPPTVSDTTTATGAAPAADPTAAAIASLKDAIGAVESAVKSAGEKVSGAVRAIPRGVA